MPLPKARHDAAEDDKNARSWRQRSVFLLLLRHPLSRRVREMRTPLTRYESGCCATTHLVVARPERLQLPVVSVCVPALAGHVHDQDRLRHAWRKAKETSTEEKTRGASRTMSWTTSSNTSQAQGRRGADARTREGGKTWSNHCFSRRRPRADGVGVPCQELSCRRRGLALLLQDSSVHQ